MSATSVNVRQMSCDNKTKIKFWCRRWRSTQAVTATVTLAFAAEEEKKKARQKKSWTTTSLALAEFFFSSTAAAVQTTEKKKFKLVRSVARELASGVHHSLGRYPHHQARTLELDDVLSSLPKLRTDSFTQVFLT
jgi:hypothetical protein